MADGVTERLESAAQGPAQAAVDGRSASQHPLTDLIEADRYLRSVQTQAATPQRRGLVISKLRPPGSI